MIERERERGEEREREGEGEGEMMQEGETEKPLKKDSIAAVVGPFRYIFPGITSSATEGRFKAGLSSVLLYSFRSDVTRLSHI